MMCMGTSTWEGTEAGKELVTSGRSKEVTALAPTTPDVIGATAHCVGLGLDG